MSKNKFIIIFICFIDILWIWIFIPTLPELTKYYWVSAHNISYAITLFALFSFLFWPILWQLSDKYWRKWILFLCIIGSFISSFIMSISQLFSVFLIWRIINWITWGNISILQSMMNDISKDKEERMHNMWIMWWIFGMWFIIGPVLWALILPLGVKAPFWLMTWLAVIEIILILLFLSETNKNNLSIKKINLNPFKTIIKYIKNHEVSIIIYSFFLLILSSSMYQWMFTIFLNKHFWLPGHYAWYVMWWIWLWVAINQAFLLKRFWMKYFSLKKLFIITNFWILIIFLLLSFINNLPLFLAVFFILVFFQWLVNPIYQNEIVETSHVNDRWEVMWVLSSLQSMSMFIWPSISWILIDKNISMFMIATVIVFINIVLFLKKILWLIK